MHIATICAGCVGPESGACFSDFGDQVCCVARLTYFGIGRGRLNRKPT